MPASAQDIAAALRAENPGLPIKKLHKLLYYCQGHYLAWFKEPLFAEAIEAGDMGPVVPELWRAEKYATPRRIPAPPSGLGSKELNTVGYVLSRYGNLTGKDLENLTHAEDPWRDADRDREPGRGVRIEQDALLRYFQADHDENSLGSQAIAELKRRADEHGPVPDTPDDLDSLRARRDEYAARAKAGTR